MKISVMFVTFVCVVVSLGVHYLTDLLQDYLQLQQKVEAWRVGGPHTTLLGKVRDRLAASSWMTPAMDPLKNCDIGTPVGNSWREVLPLMFGIKDRLACLDQQIQMAQREHQKFVIKLMVTVSMLVCCVVLAGCCLARRTLARRQKTRETQAMKLRGQKTRNMALMIKKNDDKMRNHGFKQCLHTNLLLERRLLVAVFQAITSDGLLTRQGKQIHFAHNKQVTGTPLALPPPPGEAGQARRHDKNQDPPVQINEEIRVRHSLKVPRKYLKNPVDPFLDLQARFDVQVYRDPARRKLHVKGAKTQVQECLSVVKCMVAEWQTKYQQAAQE